MQDGKNSPEGVSYFTILHLLQCFFLSFSLFLTPVYRVNFFAYFLYTLKLKIHPFDQMLRKEVPENAKYRSINFYRNWSLL